MHHDKTSRSGLFTWIGLLQLLVTAIFLVSARPAKATDLTYTFGGDANWFNQTVVSHDGVDAYQSGAITNSQSSWMETTVTGPGAIRFWWKVSSEACCDPLRFSIDGSVQTDIRGDVDWQSQAFAVPSGTHTLRWAYSTDSVFLSGSNAGWVDQITFTQGDGFDLTAPITSATPAGGLFADSRDVILSCTDNVGCSGTFYCLGTGCNPATPYSAPLTISSATTLRFYSTDAAGNKEVVKTASYSFDTVPPSTFASLSAGTYSGPHDVTLFCGDGGLGCAATYYCLGSGCTPSTRYSSAITIAATTDLRFYSADAAGNNETVKSLAFTIVPDVTAPTTTPSRQSGSYTSTSIYLFCNDAAGSGCATTYYCLGAGCTPTTTFSQYLNLSASTDVRFYSVDRAGNSEAIKTASYIIDVTPPITTPNVVGGIYRAAQKVSLSCSDGAGTGCSNTYYCLGKGCYPTSYSVPFDITSSTYLTYYSRDAAYNQEPSKTERFTISTSEPLTINVPLDKATIQAAIDAANDGDTVLVAPGTYQENINFNGKAITVESSGGADVTIIDGNKKASVVTFNSSEWDTSVLRGFTIRNGKSADVYNPSGGGIYAYGASPSIVANKIVQNESCNGAGIYAYNSSLIVRNNDISNNVQGTCNWNSNGAGIHLEGGSARIIDNTITNNTYNSTSYGNGGGIYIYGSGVNVIRGNVISHNGGTTAKGGGIYCGDQGQSQIVGNLIVSNSAGNGGGIYLGFGALLGNNTIADNDAAKGSAVYLTGYYYGNSNGVISNNVLIGKTGQTTIDGESNNGNIPPMNNNIFYSPSNDVYGGTFPDQDGLHGNITADPKLSGAAFGYYGLAAGSPAIDAGDNGASALPAKDLAGNNRLIDGSTAGQARVDIGAYEFNPDEPRALLTNSSAGVTKSTSASIAVAGTGIVSYRYAVDGGAFSGVDTPVATPIAVTGLSGGRHAVAVIGKSASGEQLVSSASVSEWTIDAVPPVTTATPDGGAYSAPQNVTLSCSDGAGGGCAGTFYCLGGGCTPNTPYTGPVAVSTSTGLRYYSRDIFGYEEPVKTASYNFVATLSGTITDSATSAGIASAHIEAYRADTGAYVGGTYSYLPNGAYQITGLPAGIYKLHFKANNYLDQWYRGMSDRSAATTVVVSAPAAINDINVAMVKAGTITGTVSDKDSRATISNVSVTAFNAVSGSLSGSAYTDSTGRYSIAGLRAGSYKLSFNAQYGSNYLSQWYSDKSDIASATEAVVANGSTTSGIDVALQKGGSLSGKVTDGVSGAGISGATVFLYNTTSGSFSKSTTTDSSGAYRFAGIAGSFRLESNAHGYLTQNYGGGPGAAVTVTAAGSTTGIDMALSKGGTITGKVTAGVSGAGLANVSVSVTDAVTGAWVNYAYTDSSGVYSITGVATGSYKIRFTVNGYLAQWFGGKGDQAAATTVAVTAPNTTAGIDITMIEGAAITGSVTDKLSGVGVEGVTVTAYNAVSGSWVGSGYTNSAGVYTISGLDNGGYKLQATIYSSGYQAKWYGNKQQKTTADIVQVTAPNTVAGIDLALEKGGIITGTVTDSSTGAVIKGAFVVVKNMATGQTIASNNTDGSGAYSVAGLRTGDYKVAFFATGYAQRWFDGKASVASASTVSVSAPATTAHIDMALTRAGSVFGTISDCTSGVGVAYASVILLDSGTGDWVGSDSTDINGAYAIHNVPSGSYRVRVDPVATTGYLGRWYGSQPDCPDKVTVTAPTDINGIDVALEMGGSISGRATDAATGLGVPGQMVYVTSTSASEVITGSTRVIDETGAYTIGGLPTGDYLLSFRAAGYPLTTSPAVAKVTAPGAVTGFNVSLPKGGGIGGKVTDSKGAGVSEVLVQAIDTVTNVVAGSSTTDYSGAYLIDGLSTGSYKLIYDGSYADSRNGGGSYGGGFYGGFSDSETGAKALASVITIGDWSPAPVPVPVPAVSVASGPGFGTTVSVSVSSYATLSVLPFPGAASVSVTAPNITGGIDFSVAPAGAISGQVSDGDSDEPLGGIYVTAYDSLGRFWPAGATTDSDGSYTITGLPSGSYRLQFTSNDAASGGYLGTWYGSGSTSTLTAEVSVLAPATSYGIDARLHKAGAISGSISVNTCPGPQFVFVKAYEAVSGRQAGFASIYNGYGENFLIGGLPAGSYKLAISTGEAGFVNQWYPGKTDEATAQPITVTTGATTSGIEVSLAAGGGSISGKVASSSGCTVSRGRVRLYDWYSGGLAAETFTNADGTYQLVGLPDASYKLLFAINGVDRWYKASAESAQASPVVVSGGAAISGIDLTGVCQPDGSLDGKAPEVIDALRALRMAVGIDAVTTQSLVHYDLAPVVDGVSVPDGKIDIADALVILRKVVSSPTVTVAH
jgi:hypothetical protein